MKIQNRPRVKDRAMCQKEFLDVVSSNHISVWFSEYFRDRERQRPIPTSEQCESIAALINANNRSLNAVRKIFGTRENASLEVEIRKLTRQAEGEAETLKRTMELVAKQWTRLLKIAASHDKDAFQEAEKQANFLQSLETYLVDRRKKRPGRKLFLPIGLLFHLPPTNDPILVAIVNALKTAGWSNPSSTSNGPAIYVYAKCLEQIYRTEVNPVTLSRSLRRFPK